MSQSDRSVEEMLAQARADYTASLVTKADELGELSARGAWVELRRAAHRLHGSAGAYGFGEVSAAAGALEDALVEAGRTLDEAVRASVVGRVRAVVDRIRSALAGHA